MITKTNGNNIAKKSTNNVMTSELKKKTTNGRTDKKMEPIVEEVIVISDSDDTEDEEEVNESEEEFEELMQKTFNESKKEPKISFKFCGSVKSDLEKPLYGVQFNTYLPKGQNYFATVGLNRVTIYECLSDPSLRLVDCFADPNSNEDLYTCCWTYDDLTGHPLVISAGKRGVIRIINCADKAIKHLIGHGSDVNDLKISPHDSNLLLSSSKDYSLRLWNIKTNVCIVKFGGDSGHRDQVICSDFYLLNSKYIVSAGMDHSIKIWSLDSQDIRTAICESYECIDEDMAFQMRCQSYPVFNTRKVHFNYIDCVQFFGRFVLSKSCDNEIVCTKPDLLSTESGFPENKVSESITSMDSFPLKDTTYWFIKFAMDSKQTLLSVGSDLGLTYVWDMDVDNPFEYKPLVLERPKCQSTIRQTSFSSDGTILICVADNGTIWRWDVIQQ